MKNRFLYRIAMSALLLFFGALASSAQPIDSLITLQIPFDFQVGEKLLPAGKYSFNRIPNMPQALIIQGSDARTVIAFTVFCGWSETPVQSGLTFNEYGGKRFLSEVKIAQHSFIYSLIKSKSERRLAQTESLRIIRAVTADGPSRLRTRRNITPAAED